LIQVPEGLAEKLLALKRLSEATSQDLFVAEALKKLGPLVQQAELLAAQYDAVVANPPYMGTKGMNTLLKDFAKSDFRDAKSDLFACFIERGINLARDGGYNAMITMQSWMFLSSFEKLREHLLAERTLTTMAHLGPRAFASISGEVVQVTAFVLRNIVEGAFRPVFFRLLDGGEDDKRLAFLAGEGRFDQVAQDNFKKIPGSPLAYWVSERVREVFKDSKSLGALGSPTHGVVTGDNDRFLKNWSEVSSSNICFSAISREESAESKVRWFPVSKGGSFRRWFGNNEFVIDWLDDGNELRTTKHETGRIRATNFNLSRIFQPGITWSTISSSALSMRYLPAGMIFESKGSVCFSDNEPQRLFLLALTNTHVINQLLLVLSPTLDYHEGPMSRLPVVAIDRTQPMAIADSCRANAQADWNTYEHSWDYQRNPLISQASLSTVYTAWTTQNTITIAEMKSLEEENNRLFIDAYGLQDELTPDVPIEQITLTVNPAYRYGGKLTEEEQWTRFRQDTIEELISYAVGNMMGRYSLDAPGLIYAHSGNEGFDPGKYTTFPADADGIVPLTDTDWFADDAAHRLIEFISVAWDAAHVEANLTFMADNLSPKKNESSRETLRRYLCDKFFKDHLQTYKKRPIYWLFSSGKQKAFQCLVYLHRYNEGTLSRMRSEYVIPLQGKMSARVDQLDRDIAGASSTAHRKTLEKERDRLKKQAHELRDFDEQLRHVADQRIALDLDDGVKVNYGKFGDLLAEVKAITGGSSDD